jgi:spermidine synthase
MQPWKTIQRVATAEGSLELRQRGERSFLITVGGRVLMTSEAHRSETELAELACAAMAHRPRPRVLLGGLGMGFTLRAVLDELPAGAEVTVVDLNPAVVAWCEGPLAFLTKSAITDRRVKVVVGDVARAITDARAGAYDAIILDLYEGPHQANNRVLDPLYGPAALRRTAAALTPDGVFAIWSEEPDKAFETRLGAAFRVDRHKGSRGGRKHVIYLGSPGAPPRFFPSARRRTPA